MPRKSSRIPSTTSLSALIPKTSLSSCDYTGGGTGAFALAGGVKSRLAPGVWTLALIGYHRTFTDAEAKNFRLSPESPPTYHPERKPTYLQHLSFQLGLVYEIERTPAP
jgi:hypothetical protein